MNFKKKSWPAILSVVFAVGVALLGFSLYMGRLVGDLFFGSRAMENWNMSNYFIVPSWFAYVVFGLGFLLFGGVFSGALVVLIFARRKAFLKQALAALFCGNAFSVVGFNTLDWMLGCFYAYHSVIDFPLILGLALTTDSWNIYFFMLVLPLWASGFLLGLAVTAYFALKKTGKM